jgi:hypothetical protein
LASVGFVIEAFIVVGFHPEAFIVGHLSIVVEVLQCFASFGVVKVELR